MPKTNPHASRISRSSVAARPYQPAPIADPEKADPSPSNSHRRHDSTNTGHMPSPLESGHSTRSSLSSFLSKAARLGRVELRGIAPIPVEERKVKRTVDVFTLWWCMNADILPCVLTQGWKEAVARAGPQSGALMQTQYRFRHAWPITVRFGHRELRIGHIVLYARDDDFTGLLLDIGPENGNATDDTSAVQLWVRRSEAGKRSDGVVDDLIKCRRYLVSIPVLLNLATLTGFCVILAVVGGQCLSAVGEGTRLTPAVGIVVMALVSMAISFCGFRVLHVYERYAWLPAVAAIVVAAACGASGLKQQAPARDPPTASSVMSFGMTVASFIIPWSCLASDFTTYLDPSTPS